MRFIVEIEYSALQQAAVVTNGQVSRSLFIVSGSRSKVFQMETWARKLYEEPHKLVCGVSAQHLDVVVRRIVKEWVETRPDVNVFHREVLVETREPLNLW